MEWRKVYVDVTVDVAKDGSVRPRTLCYEDGTVYQIERLKSTCRAASARVGGLGTRYTVEILGHESYLYDEDGRWFVEAKEI